MDPNNLNPQNPVAPDPQMAPNPAVAPDLGQPSLQSQQPAAPGVPVQTPVPQVQKVDGGQGSSSKIMFLIVGVIILLVVFGGVYFYITRTQSSPPPMEQAQQVDTTEIESLQNEANSVDIEGIEADFKEVDTDLQSL